MHRNIGFENPARGAYVIAFHTNGQPLSLDRRIDQNFIDQQGLLDDHRKPVGVSEWLEL